MPEMNHIPETQADGTEKLPALPSSPQPSVTPLGFSFFIILCAGVLLLVLVYGAYSVSKRRVYPLSMPTPTLIPSPYTIRSQVSVPMKVDTERTNGASAAIVLSKTPSIPPKPLPLKPTPTPISLHSGVGHYTVSHPKSNGPSISTVTFNPLDVQKGQVLTVSVTMQSSSAVRSVTGYLETDTMKIPLTFANATPGVLGGQTWSVSLTVPDTLWYTYIMTLQATNSTGSTPLAVAPRS